MSYDDLFKLTDDKEMFTVCQISHPTDVIDEQELSEGTTDIFVGLDFDCASELNSPSDSDSKLSESFEKPVRKQLVIGKHIKINQDDPHKFTCTLCNCNFSRRQQVRYHDYCVTGKRPLKCDLCGKGFVKKSHLIYHVRTHTGETPFKCGTCEKGFKQKAKLKRHEKTHNKDEDSRLLCSKCSKSFSDKDSLKKHEQKHLLANSFTCSSCKKSYADKFTLKQHMEIHKNPSFICDVCGKTFMRKNSLNVHLQIHNDVYPFECNSCHKTFRSKKELVQHNIVHNKDNPGYECDMCSITCGRRDNLLRHIRNCHLDPCQKKPLKDTTDSCSKEKTDTKPDKNKIVNPDMNGTKDLEESGDCSPSDNQLEENEDLRPKCGTNVKEMDSNELENVKTNSNASASSRLALKLYPPKSQNRKLRRKSKVNSQNKTRTSISREMRGNSGKNKNVLKKSCKPLNTDASSTKDKVGGTVSNKPSRNDEASSFNELTDSGPINALLNEPQNVTDNFANVSDGIKPFGMTFPVEEKESMSTLQNFEATALKRASVLVSPSNENLFEERQSTSDITENENLLHWNNGAKIEEFTIAERPFVEQSLSALKTSVIVHTNEFRALVLEANAFREPVIKCAQSSTISEEIDRKALQFREPP